MWILGLKGLSNKALFISCSLYWYNISTHLTKSSWLHVHWGTFSCQFQIPRLNPSYERLCVSQGLYFPLCICCSVWSFHFVLHLATKRDKSKLTNSHTMYDVTTFYAFYVTIQIREVSLTLMSSSSALELKGS